LPTPSNFLSIVVDHPLSDAMINVRHGPVRSYSCSRSCYCSPSLSSCCPLQRRSAVISALVQTSRFGGNAHATPYRPLRRRNPLTDQEKETKGSSVISLAGGTSCEPLGRSGTASNWRRSNLPDREGGSTHFAISGPAESGVAFARGFRCLFWEE
jgi:hypothetical protein